MIHIFVNFYIIFILSFLGKRHNLFSVLSGNDPMTTVNCGFQSKKWAFRFANQSHLVSTKEFLNCVNHCVKLPRWFLGQRGGNFFFRNKIWNQSCRSPWYFFFQKRNEAQVIFSFQSSNGFMVQRLKNARF